MPEVTRSPVSEGKRSAVPEVTLSPGPEVTRSPVPEVTRSPVLEEKHVDSTSPSSVVPVPEGAGHGVSSLQLNGQARAQVPAQAPPRITKSDSKRRFSKVESTVAPSPFSIRPRQVPCSSSPSIFAASNRPSVAALSQPRGGLQGGLQGGLLDGLTGGFPSAAPRFDTAFGAAASEAGMELQLEAQMEAMSTRTDELSLDDISMRSPIAGAAAIPMGLPEEFTLLEGDDATTNEFGIDMASVIETWKANQAASGVADDSLDVSRASTVCRGLQGMGLDREHSELDDYCGQAVWKRVHSYFPALASVDEAINSSGEHGWAAKRAAKPGAPTLSVSALGALRTDDETELLSSFGRRTAAATTATDGQQPIPVGGELEGLHHQLNMLHTAFLHTLLEDEELSGVQRELVCRHLQGTRQLQLQGEGEPAASNPYVYT